MPKLLDLELTGTSLAFRAVLGAVLAAAAFLFLYFVPANLVALAARVLPEMGGTFAAAAPMVAALIHPMLPLAGLLIAAFTFPAVLLRGSKLYGFFVAGLGILFLAYVYLAFQGGAITIAVPENMIPAYSVTAALQLRLTNLMLLFMIPPVLTIVKGFVLVAGKREQ